MKSYLGHLVWLVAKVGDEVFVQRTPLADLGLAKNTVVV